jgi:hypothetical protein
MQAFEAITFEIDFDADSWTDVTSDWKHRPNPRGQRGILSNSPTARVGSPSIFSFALNNDTNKYSPGHASAQSGFGVGNKVRMYFTFETETYFKFYGRIIPRGVVPMPGQGGPKYTEITAMGWMKQVQQQQIRVQEVATNQRADQVISTLDGQMDITPLNTDYDQGQATFPVVFDTLRPNTPMISEINKSIQSEIGLYYDKGNKTDGETVVMENRYRRATLVDLLSIPIIKEDSSIASTEAGDTLTTEAGDTIVWNEAQDCEFDNLQVEMDALEGKYLANEVRARNYPKDVDAAATTVLFTLNEELEVDAGETVGPYRVGWTDPSGAGRKVSAQDHVTPVETTDYTAFSQSGGTGDNLSSSMAIHGADGTGDADLGADGAEFTIKNNGSVTMYVYFMRIRAKGIYAYEPVESFVEDAASIAKHGRIPITLDLKYESDPNVGKSYAEIILSDLKDPNVVVNSFTLIANHNGMTIAAFLNMEPGDRFNLIEEETGIDEEFYCQGYEFEIFAGKYVRWTIIPRAASGQTYWVLDTSALDQDTALAIG